MGIWVYNWNILVMVMLYLLEMCVIFIRNLLVVLNFWNYVRMMEIMDWILSFMMCIVLCNMVLIVIVICNKN